MTLMIREATIYEMSGKRWAVGIPRDIKHEMDQDSYETGTIFFAYSKETGPYLIKPERLSESFTTKGLDIASSTPKGSTYAEAHTKNSSREVKNRFESDGDGTLTTKREDEIASKSGGSPRTTRKKGNATGLI